MEYNCAQDLIDERDKLRVQVAALRAALEKAEDLFQAVVSADLELVNGGYTHHGKTVHDCVNDMGRYGCEGLDLVEKALAATERGET